MPRSPIDVAGASTALPFSFATRAGDLVFISGQASVDQTGSYVEDDFEGEMRRSFANLEAILRAAGGGLDDVVQVTVYLGSMSFRDEFNRIYPSLWNPPFPARTTIPADFGFLKFEIDAVAHIPVG
jgi:2-iminobutanoate/2-iminopropanoate deaminase